MLTAPSNRRKPENREPPTPTPRPCLNPLRRLSLAHALWLNLAALREHLSGWASRVVTKGLPKAGNRHRPNLNLPEALQPCACAVASRLAVIFEHRSGAA